MTVTVEPVGLDAERVKAVAEAQPTALKFSFEGRGSPRHPPRLTLHGCELLTDAADWDAATWDMNPEDRERLAASLEWLLEHVPSDALVEAD